MTDLPRALTSDELTKLRHDNQATKLFLIVYQPATIYSARLAAVPSTTDQVASVTHNTNSGSASDILEDMTLNAGSAAGLRDYGTARFRKDGVTGVIADATTFNIGEESEINWQAGAYLTVLDEFLLWPRHIKIASDGTTPLMDFNIPYTNENQTAGCKPFAVMGPPRVKWLTGASVTFSLDGSNSWIMNQSIASYAWSFPGAASTTGTTTATPTATYTTAGIYRAALTVTGDNGATDTGYRYLFVVDPANPPAWLIDQFQLDQCEGNDQSGYWSFKVTLFAQADQNTIRDRAMVILVARDWYGRTQADEGSIGYVTDAENIVAWGWINGESIDWRPPYLNGKVSFDVGNPGWWLDHITGFPTGAKDIPDAQTVNKWTKFKGLTLQSAWYHWLWWRSTAHRCIDVFNVTDLNRRCSRLEAPGNQSIWQQLIQMAEKTALYRPKADHYGRLFLQLEQSLLPVADRSSIPTVMTITSQDWRDEIIPERIITTPASLLDLSGVWWDGSTATPRFSYANGRVYKHYGLPEVRDRLYIAGTDAANAQTRANELCGAYIAWRNSEFPKLPIKMASNIRMFDFAPYQRLSLPIASTAMILGIAETVTLVPKRIAYVWNAQAGTLHTEADFEKETTPDIAVTGDTPVTTPPPPVVPPVIPPPPPPIVPPTISSDAREIWIATSSTAHAGDAIYYSGDYFAGGQPTFSKITAFDGYGNSSGGINLMFMSADRSIGYLWTRLSNSKIWSFPGSAVKAPSSLVSGDFTLLWQLGDPIGGQATGGVGTGPKDMTIYKNILIVRAATNVLANCYTAWNPSAGAWSAAISLPNATGRVANNTYISHVSSSSRLETVPGLVVIGSWNELSFDIETTAGSSPIWESQLSGAHRFTLRQSSTTPFPVYLHDIDLGGTGPGGDYLGGTIPHVLSGGNAWRGTKVTGAINGLQFYYIDEDGTIYLFNGSSLDTSFAWSRGAGVFGGGWAWDAKSAGGGSIVVVHENLLQSEVLSRIYDRSGNIIPDASGNGDRTGNWWTLVGSIGSSTLNLCNVWLGY